MTYRHLSDTVLYCEQSLPACHMARRSQVRHPSCLLSDLLGRSEPVKYIKTLDFLIWRATRATTILTATYMPSISGHKHTIPI